ncbi:MAG TPA: tetratricopeptide repeat protein [Blastocatellia bacterium]|nr:tetratricopeptide repeat protein [Blastocatellia bacterium]
MSELDNGNILRFPGAARSRAEFQPVKSVYTVREIKQLFGFSEKLIRRWTEEGVIQPLLSEGGEPLYDFRALTRLRRVRELRRRGLSIKKIDAELRGQMDLFRSEPGQVAQLTPRLTPFERALACHERGDSTALELYRRAIADGDYVPDAYCNLGILEFENSRVSKAFDCFTNALKHEPRHVEAHFNLANLYFDSGDLRLARLHYEIVIELEPGFSHPYLNLGLVQALQGDFAESRATLVKYREMDPEGAELVQEVLKKLEPFTFTQ